MAPYHRGPEASLDSILIIEDDRSILSGLSKNLRYEGYGVLTAEDGERGLAMAVDRKPDLIILDLMLPGASGFEICRSLRRVRIHTPILVLTARDTEADKVMGLDLGADDYMTKPFSVVELLARAKALLRRSRDFEEGGPASYAFADVEVDVRGRALRRKAREVAVSPREFDLLVFLLRNRGRALAREEILNKVWGHDYYGTARTIDNFVTKLRQKIEKDPDDPRYLLTVRGHGYKFAEPTASERRPAVK
ncbi:MAG: response regulator transcription factor [Planctomycetales bacterium]|nr:response regulator transcription factor [Planctomycetales bacterium]